MKKIFVFILILAISTITSAGDADKYGKELTLKTKTNISSVLADLEGFEGKKVLVEGTVLDVCEKRGCWMDLASDKEGEKIRVKVDDGVIVFPMEAKGKKALVEGELYSIIIEGEGCGSDCGDKDGDEHKKEDKENCPAKKKVKKVYMIKGLGAVIS